MYNNIDYNHYPLYFLSCPIQLLLSGNNVNDGFGLAFRIIQDFKLDSSFIYCQVGHHFAKQHKYTSIKQLLGCIKDSGLSTDQSFDEVIGACIRVIATEASEVIIWAAPCEKVPKGLSRCHTHPSFGMTLTFPKKKKKKKVGVIRAPILLLQHIS